MKSLIALCILLAASNLFAVEVVTLKKLKDLWGYDYSIEFKANPELGRAWVELFTGDSYDNEDDGHTTRIKVEGMVFRDGEILFEKNGDSVVCATKGSRGVWVFRNTVYRSSGRCVLENILKYDQIDDGFEIRNVRRRYLNLVIQ